MSGFELTPFPDGEGYIDHAWRRLSARQRDVLVGDPPPPAWVHHGVLKAMRRKGLLDDNYELSERGEWTRAWAEERGLT